MTDTDKANALDWLNEIVTNTDGWRMFYSDSETKSCAEAALAMLKEQTEGKYYSEVFYAGYDAGKKSIEEERKHAMPVVHGSAGGSQYYVCSECKTPISPGNRFCGGCGKLVKWDETPI